MNTTPLSVAAQAEFKRLVSSGRSTDLIKKFDSATLAQFSGVMGGLIANDTALANGPAFVNAAPLNAAAKNAFDTLFNEARLADNPAIVDGASTELLVALNLTAFVAGLFFGWRYVRN